MSKIAFYPGTFDPLTLGHENIIQRASALFDKVVVGVAASNAKSPFFSLEERLAIAAEALAESIDAGRVEVRRIDDALAIEAARDAGAHFILRGLRGGNDLDYETQMTLMNRRLAAELDTVFLLSDSELAHISATQIREIARRGGDISSFVSKAVARAFAAKH